MSDKRKKEMSDMVDSFKKTFYYRFGITPKVHFNKTLPITNFKRIGIEEVLLVANRLFKEEVQLDSKLKKRFSTNGIFDKKRDVPKTLYKHVCFLMSRELKYSHQLIADKFNNNHSSVVTNVKRGTQLLNQGDYKMIRTYLYVAHAIKKEFGDDGSFQLNLPEGIKSKPVISALLNADWDSNIPHQHPPRVKSVRVKRVDKKPRLLQGTNFITGSSGARRSS